MRYRSEGASAPSFFFRRHGFAARRTRAVLSRCAGKADRAGRRFRLPAMRSGAVFTALEARFAQYGGRRAAPAQRKRKAALPSRLTSCRQYTCSDGCTRQTPFAAQGMQKHTRTGNRPAARHIFRRTAHAGKIFSYSAAPSAAVSAAACAASCCAAAARAACAAACSAIRAFMTLVRH